MTAPTDNLPQYFNPAWIQATDESLDADVCVYGGTASGVVAAVKAARLGLKTVLLQPGLFLGGMTTGGLGWTDYGRKHVIGGMSRQFYRDLGALHGLAEEEWHFEPSKAAQVTDQMLAGSGVIVKFAQYLDRVEQVGTRLTAVHLLGGLSVRAKVFMDCTYEGDLLAKAGADFHIGRESNATYGETLNGIQIRQYHQFGPAAIDPYCVPGDPDSGLLPWIEDQDLRDRQGEGDHRVQAYNFRVCMTDDPALKVDWFQPAGYDPREYELARRWFAFEAKDAYNEHIRPNRDGIPLKFDRLTHRTPGGHYKTDTNNHGPVSSDFIGANWDWPEASYQQREAIFQKHVSYQIGLYWFLANDPGIPQRYREAYARWGLPKDEFTETGHWPHQLYVREARRLIGEYVITEADCKRPDGFTAPSDSVGMGSYTLDSHNCTRFLAQVDGKAVVMNDGDVQIPPTDPYPISYRAITPKREQCENLLVPVCMSSSHIAFGSARMEPVFMVLGESAACAAKLAIDQGICVQDVPYTQLRPMLEEAGQVLELAETELASA